MDEIKANENESKHNLNEVIPRYVINFKAKPLKLKFFKSISIKKLLWWNADFVWESIFAYDLEVYDSDKGFETKDISFEGIKNHLIVALHCAFMHHLPLQLRPDDIWIIIAQGIATHITQNAAKLRAKFVDFDGKKSIQVEDNSLKTNSQTNDWSFVLKQFDEGCRKLTSNDFMDLMTCNFNTSSMTSQTASKCVLFKAMGEYIDFSTRTMSGIPQISLIGSVDDWAKIQCKCKKLQEMDIGLDFWLQFLIPIVNNISETVLVLSKGQKLNEKLNRFWNSIYQFRNISGGAAISGWIKTLFPYDIDMKKNNELKWYYGGKCDYARMSPGKFPASYSRAPMIWNYYGKKKKCAMYGGILGVAQQRNTGCIAPVIGWVIAGKHIGSLQVLAFVGVVIVVAWWFR